MQFCAMIVYILSEEFYCIEVLSCMTINLQMIPESVYPMMRTHILFLHVFYFQHMHIRCKPQSTKMVQNRWDYSYVFVFIFNLCPCLPGINVNHSHNVQLPIMEETVLTGDSMTYIYARSKAEAAFCERIISDWINTSCSCSLICLDIIYWYTLH